MTNTHDTSQGHDIALLTTQWAGIHVSQYVITRCIETGNHHMLLEAMGSDRMHRIAVKVPLGFEDGDRLIRERLALEELKDVAIIPEYVMHGRCEDQRPLLAMEWISGSSLSQQLRLRGTLTQHDYFDYMLQLASGLSELHVRGFATNNLHISNIMVDLGRVRIVDLGCVSHIREPRSPGTHDPRTQDMLMFGQIMRATLGDTTRATQKFRCKDEVPPRLWRLIRRCEHENPSNRPTMHDVERLLKQMLEQCQVSSSTAVSDDVPEVSGLDAFDSQIFAREATRLNAHSPNESVELLRQTNQDTTRPRQRAVLLDAQARERLRKRFVRHLAEDDD